MTENSEFIANDPTMQGTQPGTIADRYSLAEVESLSKKAARGAGFHWGLAEEAGKAARWLFSFGLPGPDALAALLRQNDGAAYATLRPLKTDGVWEAESGALCPVIAGAAICDRGRQIDEGKTIELGRTSYPLLTAFSAGIVAMQTRDPVRVKWHGVSMVCERDRITIEGGGDDLLIADVDGVTISKSEDMSTDDDRTSLFQPLSRPVDPTTWRALEEFAYRTYVPATELSRAGAGAGTTDRD